MQARIKGAGHGNRRLGQPAGSPVTGYLHPTGLNRTDFCTLQPAVGLLSGNHLVLPIGRKRARLGSVGEVDVSSATLPRLL